MPRNSAEALVVEAAEAAWTRREKAQPSIIALGVDRVRSQVDTCAWIAIGLGLAFTTVNVATFAADGAEPWSAAWLVAWLLDPMVSLLLIGVLRAEQVTSRWQIRTGVRVIAVKWSAFAATYAMNTWSSWSAATPKGVVLHSIPPIVVLLGSEVAPELRDRLTAAALVAESSESGEPDSGPSNRDEASDHSAQLEEEEPTAAGVDPRVRELAELIDDGCPVTAAQASLLHGCSARTGRRLLARARHLSRDRAAEPAAKRPDPASDPTLSLAFAPSGAIR